MVAAPQAARYPEGAGVVVVVSPIFSAAEGFVTDPDLTSIGLIQVSYLVARSSRYHDRDARAAEI